MPCTEKFWLANTGPHDFEVDWDQIALPSMTPTPDYQRGSATRTRGAGYTRKCYLPPRRCTPTFMVRLVPIIFFLTYLTATVLIFAFGPWPYRIKDGTKLYTFLTAAHLALLAGYLSVIGRSGQGYSGRWPVKRLVAVSLGVNLAILYPSAMFRVGRLGGHLIRGTVSLGDAYASSGAARLEGTPVIEYIRFFLGPWLALTLPLGVFYWNFLSKEVRVLWVLWVLGFMGTYVLMGTNQGFAYIVLLCPWLVAASHFAGITRLQWNRKIALSVAAAILFVLFFLFFTETQSTRGGGSVATRYSRAGNIWADDGNFMVRNLSGKSKRFVLSLASYLSHGYYGLYLALNKPFVPTFGVGNSYFLTRQAVRLTGDKALAQAPYPMRIEREGWYAYGLWSSIYPWIASDVSFPGTLLVVFLIGRVFALCWLDTLQGANPFAVAMFAQFVIMLFYFNANNQCLHAGEGFAAFSILLILWLTTRRRLDYGVRRRTVWN